MLNPIYLAAQAASSPWLFLAAAFLLGALHGLEPGHSKGIMTAFVVGTRGTYLQAIILALCATVSHTAVVWILAWPASYGGALWSNLAFSAYLNLISGVIILGLAWWMLRNFTRSHQHHHPHDHSDYDHSHHDHHDEHDHGHTHDHGHDHSHGHVHPHEHSHDHSHEHAMPASIPRTEGALAAALAIEEDAHARHHMREVADRFSGQKVSTGQVAVFGLSSGFAPCGAAIVILITCFRLHRPWLGFGLVAAFSLGLGFMLTCVVLLASWGVRAVGARFRRFDQFVHEAPFLSALVTAAIGVYLIVQFFRSY